MSNIIMKIVEVIFYIFLILSAIMITLKVTGNSPTLETVLSMTMTVILSFLLIATFKVAHFIGKNSEFMDTSKESFKRIRIDMHKIQKDLGKIKYKLKIED